VAMQARIRPANESDADAAAVLMAQLSEHCRGAAASSVADRFRAILILPNQAVFVAEDDTGQVMGLLLISHRPTLWHSGPSALIEDIVVDERARGQGVGRALIQAGFSWAKSHGCSEIEVTTEEENTASQAFFERLDFESTGVLLEHEFDKGRERKGAKMQRR